MIERVELRDFKSHAHTEIDVGRLTLLVGPNSSGKSSVLEALFLLCRAGTRPSLNLSDLARDPRALVRSKQEGFSIEIHGSVQSEEFEVSIDLSSEGEPSRRFSRGEVRNFDPNGSGLPRPLMDLQGDLGRTIHFKLSPRRLAAPYYSEDIPPQVGSTGEGLAPTLAYLMTYEPDKFQSLMRRVKSVLPFVKALRVRPAKVRFANQKVLSIDQKTLPIDTSVEVIGQEMVLDVEGAREVSAHVVSDGTLLTIGLLTILESSSCPNLILLDDIEQGLHPKAQRELVSVLKRLLEERSELQIVATTHSPYVVDELDASDVWILAANQDGETKARRLSDHPDAKKALEVLTTGEFLSAEGEDWVLEARHADG